MVLLRGMISARGFGWGLQQDAIVRPYQTELFPTLVFPEPEDRNPPIGVMGPIRGEDVLIEMRAAKR